MTEVEKIYNKLSAKLTEYCFAESGYDSKEYRRIKDELDKLESQRGGWYVEFKATYECIGSGISYLTDNPILCHSFEPRYFESKEEAQEYLDKAEYDKEHQTVTFKYKEVGTN